MPIAIPPGMWYGKSTRKKAVSGGPMGHIKLGGNCMSYPKTGQEVYVSLNLSNTMLTGIGKGTITREEVSEIGRAHV